MSKRALYIGPSHAAGGIPVTIDGTRQVEVEGLEYKICGDAYRSPEKLDFKGKTNIEVLDFIHTEFACKFDQNTASGNDFIICKLAVRSPDKHDRSGTVREILDQLQGEVGCKLSDGSMPEKKQEQGGLLNGIYEKKPLYGAVVWGNWEEFSKQFQNKDIVILYGQVTTKRATTFDLVDEFADVEEVIIGKADLYDITNVKIVPVSEVKAVIAKAITLPGNTVDELQRLAENESKLDYDTICYVPSIEEAAKIMGYDGISVYHDKSYPTLISVWNLGNVNPLVINNAHNHKYFEPKLNQQITKFEDGGVLRIDEYGKQIVWESGDYFIAVNDSKDARLVTLWKKDIKGRIGAIYTTLKEFQDWYGKDKAGKWLSIDSIGIDKKYQGMGFSKQMYRSLLHFSAPDVKGIYSYLPQRSNTKQIPRIYKRFFSEIVDGDHQFIAKEKNVGRFEKGGLTGYDARVHENLKQMGTEAVDWKAVPVIGTDVVEVNGKEKTMPLFDFPQGYVTAPTIYKNNTGPGNIPCCELCGKEPIATFYWIQNDKKQWTLGVGSECITHFQVASGKEMLRAAKVEEAKEFLAMLRKVCRWIKKIGYKAENTGNLTPPKKLQRDMNKWRAIWQDKNKPFVKNYSDRVFLWSFYDQLFPFDYDAELNYLLTTPVQRFSLETKKWVSAGPSDPETCRLEAEKKLLSWYTRNKDKKLEVISKFSELLTHQEQYIPESKEVHWVKNMIEECLKWNEELNITK